MYQFRWRTLVTTCAIVAVAGGSLFGSILSVSAVALADDSPFGSTLFVSAAVPTISGFSPTSGPVGTSVTITGSGFTGATSVSFHLVPASFSVMSDTTIVSTVPFGALRGTISVHTPGGNVTTKHQFFKVTPQITGFTPMFGPAGTPVTISGSAFTNATQVVFNGVAATFTVDSYSQITATVPPSATSGPLAVTTKSGKGTSKTNFTVGRIFDVTNYGAHGDGTGDNAPAFKAAIAAAQAAGGGIVGVPSGTYTFSTGSPSSIQIDGTVPITFAGAGRDTTTLVEMTYRKDLLSIRCDGTVVQDLTFNTQTNAGGHGLGDGGNNTTVQRIRVLSGTPTFGIYYPGPPGAHPGDGQFSTNNVVDDVLLNDEVTSDGFSFSFQKNGSISNVQHTGSRISLYADSYVTVTNYNYRPGTHGGTAGWVISTPCDHVTITNFVTSGQGGQIKNAPSMARVNQDITISGEKMTGGPSYRFLIGDVQNLLVEHSALDGIVIAPKIVAQGTVTSSTYTSVTHRPQRGATDAITFS